MAVSGLSGYQRFAVFSADTQGGGGVNARSITSAVAVLAGIIGLGKAAKAGKTGFWGALRAVAGAVVGSVVGGAVALGAWALYDKIRGQPAPPSKSGDLLREAFAAQNSA